MFYVQMANACWLDGLLKTKLSLLASSALSIWGNRGIWMTDPTSKPIPCFAQYISVFKFWKSLFRDYVGLIFLEWVCKTKTRRMNGSFCHWSWCPQIYIHCFPPLQTIPVFSLPLQSSLLLWLRTPLPSAPRSLVTVPVSDLHCCSWPLPIKTGQGSAHSCLRRLSGCWTHAALAPLCKSSLYFLWLLPTSPFAPKESEIKSGSHMLKFHDALSVSLGRRRTTWELGFEPGFVGMGRHRFLRCVTQSDG